LGKIFDALEKSRGFSASRPSAETKGRLPAEKKPLSDNRGSPPQSRKFVLRVPQGAAAKGQAAAADRMAGARDDRKIDRNLVALLKPNSYEAEQFKILRAALLFPSSGEPARSIMVTSALPGEGKSFVAANLAVSIAQNIREHVLLLECDLRRPSIQRYFGYNGNVTGMSDYLSLQASLSSVLLKPGVEKLTILPGGKPPHNPAELLSSNRMAELLNEVKSRYPDRYVIIDAPPPKLTAETIALSKQVDGILVVVKFAGTAREAVRDLIQLLGKKKILGVFANCFDPRSSYGYGYGAYQRYSGYYEKTQG